MARFDRMFSESEEVKKVAPHPKRETKWIHYTKLIDNQAQYCNEKSRLEIESLADLIDADEGVMQNLLVRKTGTDEYEIIAGHKRRRACRLLVEKRGKKQYEFLPCTVEQLTDVKAEFQLYSTNRFHDKDDYEKMHELERMKYLLETYPEEFPHLQTGRIVERLAKQMNMKRTTVGEYLTIAKNLGKKGKEEFKTGSLKKSAAVELAALPEKEQEELLEQGVTLQKEIKAYKEKKKESVPKFGTQEQNKEKTTEEEYQVAGQYKVVNTDMDIEEDVPESGTQESVEENVPESGTQNSIEESGIYVGENISRKLKTITSSKNYGIERKEKLETAEEKATKPDTQKEQYTPRYFLQEQKDKLAEMLSDKERGSMVPEKTLERQKLIVCAMEFYVKRMVLE